MRIGTARPLMVARAEATPTPRKAAPPPVDSFLPALRQGPGPRIDPFNAVKDWAADRAFEALRPSGPADRLQGAQRVAYGPLDAPPTLRRPVVMVPGLTMPARSFGRLADQLATDPANGAVAVYVAAQDTFRLGSPQGRPLTRGELERAKVFLVEYRDPWAASTVKAAELDRAMKRISGETRAAALDVVTHSAGGTDFRHYLDARAPGSPRIARAVLIGPASHGTFLGNLGAVVGNPLKNVDDAARELAVGSPMIEGLNARWEGQRQQVEGGVTIIGTTGTPTLGPAAGLFEDGDGYMPTAQLALAGARTVLLPGPHRTPLAHLWQVQYAGVVNATLAVLGS